MFDVVRTILVAISGIAWSAVYVDCARTDFKDKTYCMPLWALGLNIAWEGIYAYTDLFVRQNVNAQAIANTCWFVLDILLVMTYLKYGKQECKTVTDRKWFLPWTVLVIAVCFGLQMLFIAEFGSENAEIYSAYLQNLLMSVSFLMLLNRRRSARGQTMLIAVSKCVGTVAPTIIGIMENKPFIIVVGIMCAVFDIIYIFALLKIKVKQELS